MRGGSETYYFALKDLLIANGHNVIDFSMADSRNFKSDYSNYFVNQIDYSSTRGFFDKLKVSAKIIYSAEARQKIRALIKDHRPDVAHLHLFQHQISPSILYELKNNKIPVVYTTHDLKCVCPNYKMLSKGNVCERCKRYRYYNCLFNKCVKNSFSKSLINVMEMYIHHLLKIHDMIDCFITPSKFYKNKMIEYGFAPNKIAYLPNFIDSNKYQEISGHKNYFIYIGRLSEEKGLSTLINAMKFVDISAELHIVGTGPMEETLAEMIIQEKLEDRVKLLGFKSGNELAGLIGNSMFGIIPSEWYENSPYAVLELMAYGKPVIGANIGGIPELIEDGISGLIFEEKNVEDLARKINSLNSKEKIISLGQMARIRIETEYNPLIHYKELYGIYQNIMGKNA